MKSLSHVQLFVTPWMTQPTRLLCPWNFLGKNTGVGCHFLMQWLYPGTEPKSPVSSSLAGRFFFFLLFFFFFKHEKNFVLGYNQLTMWWFQTNSEGTQPYIYMYPFSLKPLFHPGWHIPLSRVPCAIQ